MKNLKELTKDLKVFEMSKIQNVTIQKSEKAITLIVLVITIIVLLILAGASISLLTGDNGIVNKALEAKEETQKADVKERVQMDLLEYQMTGKSGITKEEFKNVLDQYFEKVPEAEALPDDLKGSNLKLQSKKEYGGQEIEIADIYSGKLGVSENIPDPPTTKPGNPNSETGIFEENSTIDGKPASASNPTIPKGFKPVGVKDDPTIDAKADCGTGTSAPSPDALKNGLVIQGEDGSQFVWIPVPTVVADQEADGTANKAMAVNVGDETTPKYRGLLYDFEAGTNGGALTSVVKNGCTKTYEEGNHSYKEPANLTDKPDGKEFVYDSQEAFKEYLGDTWKGTWTENLYQGEYNDMIKSVKTYGGFYVGRYEMSLTGSGTTSSSFDPTGTAQSKANVKTASAGSSELKNWYGLYEKAKTYANDSNQGTTITNSGVISSMMWGSQYDAMMNWMQGNGIDVTSETAGGATYNNEKVTGKKDADNKDIDKDKINNIYDLLGCNREWTLEANRNSGRVLRGGRSTANASPSSRDDAHLSTATTSSSSRLTLYVK